MAGVAEGYVTTTPIILNINSSNMRNAVKFMDNYPATVQRGIDKGHHEVARLLKNKMLDYLDEYGLGDSSIASDIQVKVHKAGISISVGADYAVYVEYGTGVVGEEDPHPKPSGWHYDVNAHGEKGWFYPTTQSDPNPYKHTYNGQLYGWTKGRESSPFMYRTWLYGSRMYTQTINKFISLEVNAERRRLRL